MDEFAFALSIVFLSSVVFLAFVKMVIGYLKWRHLQKKGVTTGASDGVAISELEEMFRQAALEANDPLERRLDKLERRLRDLPAAVPAPPVILPKAEEAEAEMEEAPKSLGRLSTGGSAARSGR